MAIKKPGSKHSRRTGPRRSRRSARAQRRPRSVDGRKPRREPAEGELRAAAGLSSSEELAAETAALGLEDWDEDLPVE